MFGALLLVRKRLPETKCLNDMSLSVCPWPQPYISKGTTKHERPPFTLRYCFMLTNSDQVLDTDDNPMQCGTGEARSACRVLNIGGSFCWEEAHGGDLFCSFKSYRELPLSGLDFLQHGCSRPLKWNERLIKNTHKLSRSHGFFSYNRQLETMYSPNPSEKKIKTHHILY